MIAEVLSGARQWHVEEGDAVPWLEALPAKCLDLCFFSPPYESQRSYGIGFNKKGQEWVDWMVRVFHACLRACKGLVACVCEGPTRKYRWTATPALLIADLHRAGIHLRKTVVYQKNGLCGSSGPDWLRNDWEHIICATGGGRLPWSDNVAMGKPCKYGVGGELSYRTVDGTRINQRKASLRKKYRKSQRLIGMPMPDGTVQVQSYVPPALANPGNVIHCNVGGGRIGDLEAHENEAAFPEQLAEFFVRSFCPPGGIACDPFCGSGTTGAVAIRHGRRFLGCDIRQSQIELSSRRIALAMLPSQPKKEKARPKKKICEIVSESLFDAIDEPA